jgi:hypothetical protein
LDTNKINESTFSLGRLSKSVSGKYIKYFFYKKKNSGWNNGISV